MVTKAIVDDVSDKYEIKVRIPMLDRASVDPRYVTDAYLPSAPICTLPNTGLNLRKGDIVWVSFENGDPSRPVIVGCLYTDKLSETEASIALNSLSVSANANLPKNTSIGNVTSEELQRLGGVSENVQAQIEGVKDSIGNKSTIYSHSVSFAVSDVSTTVYVNMLTNSSAPLTASDFVDSSDHGNPSTINRVTNIWGTRYYSGSTRRGVGITMGVSYNENSESWRKLVMYIINYDGTIDVVELEHSSLSGFSDIVTKL